MSSFTHDQIEELKIYFQTKEKCESQMKTQDDKIASLDNKITAIDTKLKILIYIGLAICCGANEAFPALAKLLFG